MVSGRSGRRQIGWRLVFAGGVIPALAGLALLVLAAWSATFGFREPWLSLVGRHSFSGELLQSQNQELFALWELTNHICGVNLAMSGVFISSVAFFALRNGARWAWVLLLVAFLWVGGNDAIALVRYRYQVGAGVPFTLIHLSMGLAGLFLARPGDQAHVKGGKTG